MKPKILAVLAVGLLLGADDQPAQEVEKAITALNEAFHARDADKVKALMTDDHVAVTSYYDGPLDRAGQLKCLPDHQLTEYAAGKFKLTSLGKDAVLVTYPLTLKGTYKGKAVPAKNFASAVWVRQEGKWLEAFYQETPLGAR
jgi:ketosteroid isomerase-like protein